MLPRRHQPEGYPWNHHRARPTPSLSSVTDLRRSVIPKGTKTHIKMMMYQNIYIEHVKNLAAWQTPFHTNTTRMTPHMLDNSISCILTQTRLWWPFPNSSSSINTQRKPRTNWWDHEVQTILHTITITQSKLWRLLALSMSLNVVVSWSAIRDSPANTVMKYFMSNPSGKNHEFT